MGAPQDRESRRAALDMQALSPNVAGRHGIRNAKWSTVVLAVALIISVAAGLYYLTAARQYTGRVEWQTSSNHWRLRLGPTGPLVDFDETGNNVTVDGAAAALPTTPTPYLTDAVAQISWTPYITKRNGASGEVRAIDIRP